MLVVEKEKCCGCRTCLQACPVGAIKLQSDEYGFERVHVDDSKCLNCNKCKKVCPILNPRKQHDHLLAGSAYARNEDIKRAGSSGGLFGVFANIVIKNGGVVYGAAFDDNLKLKTTRAETEEQLQGLFKSKYLLCDTTDSFNRIKEDLESGKKVLYCSSPCQLSGLKGFLNKEYKNLVCVEFVCHGVGGQEQFDKSIEWTEKKKNIRILRFNFREKYKKASSHYYCYQYVDLKTGKEHSYRDIYMTFPYYYAYSDRLTCRESCYSCPFATRDRVGDITIGDFHEITKYQPEIDRFAGISMFVCNSNRGLALVQEAKEELEIKEYPLETIFINNRFSGVEIVSKKSQNYLAALTQEDYAVVVRKYLSFTKDWRYYYYSAPEWVRKLGNRLVRRS